MKGSIYEGLGNTFLLCPGYEDIDYSALAERECPGYSCDGLIAFREENSRMEIYNKDGSRATMCGNGIRCLAQYLWDSGRKQDRYLINTDAGIRTLTVCSEHPFVSEVNLGSPKLIKELSETTSVEIERKHIYFNSLFLTTFQVIVMVDEISNPEIFAFGKKIFEHPLFQGKCNITFCELVDFKTIRTRTYERGVGFTLSCGTGAAGAAYICHLLYHLSDRIRVEVPTGEMIVTLRDQVYLQGPSSLIREVELDV